jgi:hypothetical protein
MARHEADREDLWAEAVSLVSRAELMLEGSSEPILAGFRDNGWFSIYFGQDVMLQFTPDGGLRRAYRQGDLYRSQGTTLARLRRQRTAEETTLLRFDLPPDELKEFRAWMIQTMDEFHTELTSGRLTVSREINRRPAPLLNEVLAAVRLILSAENFLAPAIPGIR